MPLPTTNQAASPMSAEDPAGRGEGAVPVAPVDSRGRRRPQKAPELYIASVTVTERAVSAAERAAAVRAVAAVLVPWWLECALAGMEAGEDEGGPAR